MVTRAQHIQLDPTAGSPGDDDVVVSAAPGVPRDELLDHLFARYERAVVPPMVQVDIYRFGIVRGLVAVIAWLLVALAVAALSHSLMVLCRRSRTAFAVLHAVGFTHVQLLRVVLWCAAALAAVGIAVGILFGIAGGRWGWRMFRTRMGVVSQTAMNPWWIVVVGLLALAVALVIAVGPALVAVRRRESEALRAE